MENLWKIPPSEEDAKEKGYVMGAKLITASMAVLTAASLAVPALAGPRQRTQVEAYETGAGIRSGPTVVIWTLPVQTWVTFQTQPGDKKVRIDVEDALGTASLVHVHLDRGNDLDLEVDRDFCASSIDLRVSGDDTIEVMPLTGTCHDGTFSLASRGEIVATFSR